MSAKNNILLVLMNGRTTGRLVQERSGAIEFRYDPAWLAWRYSLPISLSMSLREEPYTGETVRAVFDNLLPDNPDIRRNIAERVGAAGTDAFSLLNAIGRDCVGALQFIPEGFDADPPATLSGRPVSDREIENILHNLKRTPLGIGGEFDFRISIAGVQEKMALLWRNGLWQIPTGVTPTTHILKPAIGTLENGMDLSESVENEHFCLTFLTQLGVPAAHSEIVTFGKTRALVVERFDRIWSGERLIRRPQEDMCQALGIPWTRKYENEGGPGILRILTLLKSSQDAANDRRKFLTAQILFWILGATDGHAKNFSIHLFPGGLFVMAPLYDVLSTQSNVDLKQIRLNGFKLAMAVGDKRYYAMKSIAPRHYRQMADSAGMAQSDVDDIFARLSSDIPSALERTIAAMPRGFPSRIAESITAGATRRLSIIASEGYPAAMLPMTPMANGA